MRSAKNHWIFLALLLASGAVARAESRALLVGINEYRAPVPETPERPKQRTALPESQRSSIQRNWRNLKGSINDVEAIAALLRSTRGFAHSNIRLLRDHQATRVAILGALDTLSEHTSEGDIVVFYYSGHGSQMINPASQEPDGKDETIVPADSRFGVPDIRDKELRAAFNRILDKGAVLTVVIDSCHSGSGVRQAQGSLHPRSLAPIHLSSSDTSPPGPQPEDRGAIILTAAQDNELAYERRYKGETFGAFTLALIDALRASSINESADLVYRRVRGLLRASRHQQRPTMLGNEKARARPLFGARTDIDDVDVRVAVERVEGNDVILQGGWMHGLATGSELTSTNGGEAILEVVSLQGLSQSLARLKTTGPKTKDPGSEISRSEIQPGDLLRLSSWSAPPGDSLHIFLTSSSACPSIGDPEQNILSEISERILAHPFLEQGNVEQVESAEWADYQLIIRPRGNCKELAWSRHGKSNSQENAVPSPFPIQTPWRTFETGSPALTEALAEDLRLLTRISGWQTLRSPWPSPFHLALRVATGSQSAHNSMTAGTLRTTVSYEPVISVSPEYPPNRIPTRYIYIFVVNAQGQSTLLYPRQGTVDNRFPGSRPGPFFLLGDRARFDVVPPLGVDTYFLLTSSEPIPDPWVLEWDGLKPRNPARTPLGSLLTHVASGTRNPLTTIRSRWSIERLIFMSAGPDISSSDF